MSVPVVEIENLVKRYQELVALDHFTLTIEEGEIFGLLGPNGSGKTTTINCILALLAFDKGTVRVFGREMRPDSYDLKRQIGVVMQNVAVFQELTVYENIDYFCGLYIRDKALRRQYVEEAIDFVGLNDFRKFIRKAFRRSAAPSKYRVRNCPQAKAHHSRRADCGGRPAEPQ